VPARRNVEENEAGRDDNYNGEVDLYTKLGTVALHLINDQVNWTKNNKVVYWDDRLRLPCMPYTRCRR
jgi:hypothetical protein